MFLIVMAGMAAQAAAVTPQSASPPPNRIECRMVQQINTRIPQRVCLSQAKWDQIERENQAEMRSSRHRHGDGPLKDNGVAPWSTSSPL